MNKRTWWSIASVMLIASMLLASCATPTPEKIVETVIVTQEVEGETVEVVVTATPEPPTPEPTEEPMGDVSPEFKNPDTYIVVTGAGEPETLDPSWTYETAGSAVENNIYEGVIWFNKDRTDEFVPMLATDWAPNEAGDQWTFNIREGVTFHEGGTLEPHDIAYSMQRGLLQGRIDGPHWMSWGAFFGPEFEVFSIQAFAAAYIGKENFEDLTEDELVQVCEAVKEAVVADDEAGTVTYNLNQPTPWFLSMLANSFMGATYDQEWMVENGAWDGSCETWTDYADPAAEDTILFDQANGTGPYMLDHWTPGEEIVLVANENYWREEPMWDGGPSGAPSIKRVMIQNVDEWGTRLAMFEAGDADYVYVPPSIVRRLNPTTASSAWQMAPARPSMTPATSRPGSTCRTPLMTPAQMNWQINIEGGNPFVGSGELDGNGVPPDFFQDIHVRKAFNYCMDFEAMIQDALNGEGIQAQGPIIQGMMGYLEGQDPLYSYDPAMCEEEFKQAFDGELWENGFYMQLAYNTGNDTRRLASEILKAGIETVNPKFNVSVVGMPWPVLLNSRRAGKLPIYVGGWLEDFHDPHNWVQPFLHPQGAYGRVVNMPEEKAAEYADLIEQAASLTTAEERRPIYEEIQLKAQEEAVNIWLYQGVGRVHLQEWIQNFYYNPAYSSADHSYVYALSKVAP